MAKHRTLGGTATFTLTLKNDSTTTQPVRVFDANAGQCGSLSFVQTAKVGTTDV